MESINEIKGSISEELSQVKQRILSNSAVASKNTDVFNQGPSEVKVNGLQNNEKSVKALYEQVNSHLFRDAMPILNAKAIDVEHDKTKYETSKEHIEDFSDVVNTKFEDLKAQQLKDMSDSKTQDLTIAKKTYEQVKARYESIKSEYELTANRVRRHVPVIKFKSAIAYYALLIFIGVCEIPLNKVIFQRFGESDTITMIMAGTLAIAVPVIAHFIGMFWRQRGEMSDYKWKAIIMTSLFLITNVGLGVFRANVLGEIIASTGAVVTASQYYLNIGIFVGITTILFLIGVIAAYFRHDESYSLEHTYAQYSARKPIYEAARDAYHATEKQLNAELTVFNNALPLKYEDTVKSILAIPDNDLRSYNNTISDYESVLETARGIEKSIQEEYNYMSSAMGLDNSPLEKHFSNIKEFAINN